MFIVFYMNGTRERERGVATAFFKNKNKNKVFCQREKEDQLE